MSEATRHDYLSVCFDFSRRAATRGKATRRATVSRHCLIVNYDCFKLFICAAAPRVSESKHGYVLCLCTLLLLFFFVFFVFQTRARLNIKARVSSSTKSGSFFFGLPLFGGPTGFVNLVAPGNAGAVFLLRDNERTFICLTCQKPKCCLHPSFGIADLG